MAMCAAGFSVTRLHTGHVLNSLRKLVSGKGMILAVISAPY